MSALNATYDVIWGVPDGEGLDCSRDPTAAGQQLLPTCVNTSFPGYAGNWTMLNRQRAGLSGGGLTTATHFEPSDFGRYPSPPPRGACLTQTLSLPPSPKPSLSPPPKPSL